MEGYRQTIRVTALERSRSDEQPGQALGTGTLGTVPKTRPVGGRSAQGAKEGTFKMGDHEVVSVPKPPTPQQPHQGRTAG